MIDFNYYIVTTYYDNVPFFTTCALVNEKFYRISDFNTFSKDGKSGISDEEVKPDDFKLLTNIHFSI